jgi:hypothetical protein
MGTPTRRAVLKGTAAAAGLAEAAPATPAGTSSGHPKASVLLVTGRGSMGPAGAGSSPSCSGAATTSWRCSCR